VIVTGDKLHNYETLIQIGQEYKIETPIQTSKASVVQKLHQLVETGATALGPAMTICVGMTQACPGSKIVLATDGLANMGVGSLDDPSMVEQNSALYTTLAHVSKQNGITINVIGIKGDSINMDTLGILADITGGEVDIVDPLNITNNFSSIMEDKLVATEVVVKLFLHKGFAFPKDAEWISNANDLGEKSKQELFARRIIGNAFSDTEITAEFTEAPSEVIAEIFEKSEKEEKSHNLAQTDVMEEEKEEKVPRNSLGIKDEEKEEKVPRISLGIKDEEKEEKVPRNTLGNKEEEKEEKLPRNSLGIDEIEVEKEKKELPFQVQITYTALSGMKCTRVITKTKEVTGDSAEVEKDVDVTVLGMHANFVSAQKAQRGDMDGAIETTEIMNDLLEANLDDDVDSAGYSVWKSDATTFSKEVHQQRVQSAVQGLPADSPKSDGYSNMIYKRKNAKQNKKQWSSRRKY